MSAAVSAIVRWSPMIVSALPPTAWTSGSVASACPSLPVAIEEPKRPPPVTGVAASWRGLGDGVGGVGLLQVEARQLGQRGGVLRPQLGVGLERGDRLVVPVLRLERGREVVEALRLLRMLRHGLLQLGDRSAAAGAAAEEREPVVEDVADPGRAGADSERDEADREHDRERDEHPLRVGAQAREEESVVGVYLGDAATGPLAVASIRLRALVALRFSSCHRNPPLSYRASPSTRVVVTDCGEPPKTRAAAGSSHGK